MLESWVYPYYWYEIQDNIAYWQEFEKIQIVWGNLATEPKFAFAKAGYYLSAPASTIPEGSAYLLGILNSSISKYIVAQSAAGRQGGFLEFKPMYVSQIPIPTAPPATKRLIETLVDYCIYLTRTLGDAPTSGPTLLDTAHDSAMAGYFERIIDGLVYELFLPDELAAAGSEFATLLEREALPTLREMGDEPLAALRRVYERLYTPQHPIRKNLFFLDTIEAVRVIEGK